MKGLIIEGRKLKICPPFNNAKETESPTPITKKFWEKNLASPPSPNHSQESDGEADIITSTIPLPGGETPVTANITEGYSGDSGDEMKLISEVLLETVLQKSNPGAHQENQSSGKTEGLSVDDKSPEKGTENLRDYINNILSLDFEESADKSKIKYKKSRKQKAQEI